VSGKGLMRMLQEQEYRCALSGEKLTPKAASLDHITPLSKGGQHVMSNVQIVSKAMNKMKGTMTQQEFIAVCKKVAQWNG